MLRTGVRVVVGLCLLPWSGFGQADGSTAARLAGGPVDAGVAAPLPGGALPFAGGWLRPDGGLVSAGHDEAAPFLMDFASRRRWRLEPREAGAWGLAGSQPPASVTPTARGTRLALSEGGASASTVELRPLPLRTEEVTFRSGDVTLSGTLWLPSSAAPRAAVVLLHDADAGTRRALEPYPAFLVQQGLAVLTYDRRGAGRSSGAGQPWESGVREWADDGLAAARLLKERAGMREVGLLGFGQGAWVAVHAAARAPEVVGFLVLVSGGGDALWKQEQHRLRNEARRRGLTGPEVVDLAEHVSTLHDARLYAPEREAKALKMLDFQLKRAKRKRWFAVSPLAGREDMPLPQLLEVQRAVWRNVLSYDPAEDLARVRVPVLALLGGEDAVTPARATARALSQGLQWSGDADAGAARPQRSGEAGAGAASLYRNGESDAGAGAARPQRSGAAVAGAEATRVTVKVLPGADHRLALPPDAKQPGVETTAEDVFPVLEAWLRGLAH
ncbi:alpha/beta hydrolase family protein [Pyxidicoccus trucidator]|uniref:alpha/beta hydrolase family protein n=1 Tax=Pyxidicoccus trucidator TaxID=2709662 RepID=UPI0013DA62C9|nr:alpha/beta fold hydrolase [Pyxidicoccus trucidator]